MHGNEWRWICSAADPQGWHQPCHPVLPCKRELGPAPSHTHGAFPALLHGWEGLRTRLAYSGLRAGSRTRAAAVALVGCSAAAFPTIHLLARFVPCAGGVLCPS